MKILLFIPILFVFASCKKDIDVSTTDSETDTKNAYIILNCENCKIDYGMPDQYRGFSNSNGDSQKFPFTYKEGYTLSMHVTSLVKEQTLSVKVYNKDSKIVYQGSNMQPITDYWDVNVLLPAE